MTITPEELEHLTTAVAAHAEEYDASGAFPARSIAEVHRRGLLEATVGKEFGGSELSQVETSRLIEALGRADPSVALIVTNTLNIHRAQQASVRSPGRTWPEELYRAALARADHAPVLINTARAEPELGAPARGGLPKTTITRADDGGWVLTGHKSYVTASEGLSYHLVWAKTDEATPRVGHVVVPGDSPGVHVEKTWDHLGLRASSTHDVVYRDVQVPEGNFLASAGSAGGQYADTAGPGAVLHFIAIYVGVARAAQEFFTQFTRSRVPSALGVPIAETERIQRVAGEIELQLSSVRRTLYALSERADSPAPPAADEIAAFKVLAARALTQSVSLAVESLGNPALTRNNPLQRHLRDILNIRVHPPQDDAVVLRLGKRVLGGGPR